MLEVKNINNIAPHEGPHTIPGISFRPVRAALGVGAWGMNVLEFAPNCEGYPEHDHQEDQQEEVYWVLAGKVVVKTPTEEKELATGDMLRVPAETKRKLLTRDSHAVVLAIGGTPGKAFQVTF
jgi:uncharacterized cupin superfamily protein